MWSQRDGDPPTLPWLSGCLGTTGSTTWSDIGESGIENWKEKEDHVPGDEEGSTVIWRIWSSRKKEECHMDVVLPRMR